MTASSASPALTGASENASTLRSWRAVYAMALCSFALVASEFMPVSLLSPIASDLHLTEGQAGQAIAVSGLLAVLTSLSLATAVARLDRRAVLLGLIVLLVMSGTVVAAAPNFFVLMIGRAMLGVAIGGFWSMSAATVMRLVPAESVPKALAILNGGAATATVLGAPLGSYMGGLIGWRGAFFSVVPLALAAALWLFSALPRLPAPPQRSSGAMVGLLRNRTVVMGLLGVMLLFVGQFTLYTYLRPFLEQVTHVGLPTVSTMLLIVGISGLVGSSLVGRVLRGGPLYRTLALLPATMALVATGIALFGRSVGTVGALLAIWGFASTAGSVVWWTWLTRAAPADVEAGGGLMVAVIQVAITLGATVGGLAYDMLGPVTVFAGAAAILTLAAAAAFLGTDRPLIRPLPSDEPVPG